MDFRGKQRGGGVSQHQQSLKGTIDDSLPIRREGSLEYGKALWGIREMFSSPVLGLKKRSKVIRKWTILYLNLGKHI